MTHLVRAAVLVALTASAGVAEEPVEAHRLEASLSLGDPPVQSTTVTGAIAGDEAEYRITTVAGNESVVIDYRLVDGRRYTRINDGDQWGEVDRFNLDEAMPVVLDDFAALVDGLDEVGREEREGREQRHLVGDRDDLVPLSVPDLPFDRLSEARLDLWVDVEGQFVTEVAVAGSVEERGQTLGVSLKLRRYDIGADITIAAPTGDDLHVVTPPPGPDAAEITESLGVAFPLEADWTAQVHRRMVTILTTLPLAEARAHVDGVLRGAGFEAGTVEERHPDEFTVRYSRGEHVIEFLCFQVSDTGASVRLVRVK